MTTSRVICAWCKADLGELPNSQLDSHGICEDCYTKMLSDFNQPRNIITVESVDAVRDAWTESEFQSHVCRLATDCGWLWYHTHDSRRSRRGFPDLILVKGNRQLAWELKAEGKTPSKDQLKWMDGFSKIPGCKARVLWPDNWDYICAELES